MSDYESIHGTRVKYLTSDPTLDSSYEGQVWYNSTSGTNKALVQIKAVSSGGNTPTNFYYAGGVGPTTATLGISGVGPSPQPAHNLVIEYNGFSWSSETNIPVQSRAGYDFGTATAAVYAAGDYSPSSPTQTMVTREYDGSSWTTGNDIPNGQGSFGAATGVLTAGLCFGGYANPQSSTSVVTVSYDGTNWTDLPSPGADTNTPRNFTRGGGGPQTAAIFSGGNPTTGATEAFDGSSWTSLNSMNTARYGSGFNGTQTIGIYMGGVASPGRVDTIEEWDGVSWSTSPATLATATNGTINSKGGSVSSNLIAAGWPGSGATTSTQEYNSNINAITKAAWASGGAYPTSVGIPSASSTGTQTAQLAAGGYVGGSPGRTNVTGEYNGTSWSTGGTVPALVDSIGLGGTQTAAISAGEFRNDPTNTYDTSRDYDGSSWTTNNSLPAPAFDVSVFGTQTACIGSGGVDTAPYPARFGLDRTLSWDGTNWTSLSAPSNQNTARFLNARAGVQTAAMISGGNDVSNYPGGAPKISTVENWDGSSWTAGTSMNTARSNTAGGGVQTLAYVAGGNTGSTTTQTEIWDGSSWATSANLATAGEGTGGTGTTTTAGIMFGRRPGTATEEFTGGTETITASTLTTS